MIDTSYNKVPHKSENRPAWATTETLSRPSTKIQRQTGPARPTRGIKRRAAVKDINKTRWYMLQSSLLMVILNIYVSISQTRNGKYRAYKIKQ